MLLARLGVDWSDCSWGLFIPRVQRLKPLGDQWAALGAGSHSSGRDLAQPLGLTRCEGES